MKLHLLFLLALLSAACPAAGPVLTVSDQESQLASNASGNQRIRVKVEADNFDFTLRAKLAPYGKAEPRLWSKFVKAAPETELMVELKEYGYYELTVYAFRGKEEIGKVVTNYALVPPPLRERPKEFGCCVHFGQGRPKGAFPLSFELMKMAGFTRMRDDLYWSSFERKAGEYKIPERLEKAVDTGLEYGIKTLLVIGYNNTVAYPGKFGRPFPPNEEMYRTYGNAVVAGIQQFGSRVTEWELWNEPHPSVDPAKDYLPMLKVVYPMAKTASPDITVISCGGGGSGGGPGGGMILPIIKAGGVDFQDAFSIHPYQSPYLPEVGYEAKNSPVPRVNIPVVANHMRNISNRNPRSDGKKLQVYITEIGWHLEHPTKRMYPLSPMLQAACAARMFLNIRRENTYEGVYWYDFQDDGTDEFNREHNFGLIRADYSPKPSFQAVAVMSGLLGNLPFTRALQDKEHKVYYYGSGSDSLVAAWTMGDMEQNVEIELPFPAANARLLNWEGRPQKTEITGELKIKVKLSYLPHYIISN